MKTFNIDTKAIATNSDTTDNKYLSEILQAINNISQISNNNIKNIYEYLENTQNDYLKQIILILNQILTKIS